MAGDDDLAPLLGAGVRADKAQRLHAVNDLGRAAVAEVQGALQGRGADLVLGDHDLERLPEFGILVVAAATAKTVEIVDGHLLALALGAALGGLQVDTAGEVFVVYGAVVVFLDVGDHALHLALGHERALHADGFVAADGGVEHITATDELVRAHGVKNGTGVNCGLDRKGNTRGDVRLDQTRDDVHRGALSTDD